MSRASTIPPAREQELVTAAGAGSESAFATLVEPYRGELHAHCYRMLGSVHDAEDALQDTLLRAWRAIGRFEGRSSLRSWLYTIATNTSLNLIAKRPKRVLPIDYGPATDPTTAPASRSSSRSGSSPIPIERIGIEDGLAGPDARYEMRESVELAFVAALQYLPANQRAVLILREVLGFSAAEVAETLETTVASVNSALQRARKTVDERLPDQSQQATLRSLGDTRLREIVDGYVDAWMRGDVDAVDLDAVRGRNLRDAAAAQLVRPARADQGVPRRLPALRVSGAGARFSRRPTASPRSRFTPGMTTRVRTCRLR